jgi:hypothetical protein
VKTLIDAGDLRSDGVRPRGPPRLWPLANRLLTNSPALGDTRRHPSCRVLSSALLAIVGTAVVPTPVPRGLPREWPCHAVCHGF